MTVSVAIRELEKIEMIRDHDQIYRLAHAVTKPQKTKLRNKMETIGNEVLVGHS